MADWSKIRTEYLTTDVSYRKLSEKYDVPRATLERKAKEEGWTKRKKDLDGKVMAKTIEKMADSQAARADRLQQATDKLMEKVLLAMEGAEDAASLRSLSRTLLDIKDLQGIKSEADQAEQNARIAILRKQAAEEDSKKDITVSLEGVGQYAD